MGAREIADAHWAKDFGCAPSELRPSTTHVQEHAANLADSGGIWALVAGGAPLVSLPSDLLPLLGGRARAWTAGLLADEAWLPQELACVRPGRLGLIIGPAAIAYGTAAQLDLRAATQASPCTLTARELIAFRAACLDGWDHGGPDDDETALFGARDDRGELAALASYRVWSDSVAHIAIVTRSDRRGRGFGRAAVACAAEHALGAGLLPQYRTLCSNAPSLAIGKSLGFIEYGFSVYVRAGEV
jgi:GNAT superfamily N-acetyltransferase